LVTLGPKNAIGTADFSPIGNYPRRSLAALMGRVGASLAGEPDQVPADFHALVGGPLCVSLWLRLAIAVGILGLMTAKPGALGSLEIMGAAVLVGIGAAIRLSRRREPLTA
jgi:hypothetical protein